MMTMKAYGMIAQAAATAATATRILTATTITKITTTQAQTQTTNTATATKTLTTATVEAKLVKVKSNKPVFLTPLTSAPTIALAPPSTALSTFFSGTSLQTSLKPVAAPKKSNYPLHTQCTQHTPVHPTALAREASRRYF